MLALSPSWAGPPGDLSIEAAPLDATTGTSSGRRWTIYLDGYIDSLASQRFTNLIGQHGITDAAVYFNSPGGSLLEGMAIGRTLRARGFETHVGARAADAGRPKPGVCYSACPFAFAGGVQRYLEDGSVLGVHRAENRVPVPDDSAFQQLVSRQATEYLAVMGILPELFAIMEEVPQNQIRLLTREEAEQLKLVNDRAGRP